MTPPPPPLKILNRICIDLKNDPNGPEKNGFPLKNGKIPCLCIVCLWLSLLKQKLNTTRSICNVERAPYYIAIQLQLRPIN